MKHLSIITKYLILPLGRDGSSVRFAAIISQDILLIIA